MRLPADTRVSVRSLTRSLVRLAAFLPSGIPSVFKMSTPTTTTTTVLSRATQPDSLRHLRRYEATQLLEIIEKWKDSAVITSETVRKSYEELNTYSSAFLVRLIRRNQTNTEKLQSQESPLLQMLRLGCAFDSYSGTHRLYIVAQHNRLEIRLAEQNERIMQWSAEAFDAIDILDDRGDLHIAQYGEDDYRVVRLP